MFTLRARGVRCPEEVMVTAESVISEALGADAVPAIDVDGEALGHVAMSRLVEALTGRATTLEAVQQRLPVAVHWPPSPGV